MNILVSVRRDSGPSYHRLIYPTLLLDGPNVFLTNDLPEKYFKEKNTELYLYNRILGEPQHSTVMAHKKELGFLIGVDIDDFWELDPSHILYDEYLKTDFASQQIKEIKAADFVTTTNSFLAEEIQNYNPNVYVLSNSIPNLGRMVDPMFDQFFTTKKTVSKYNRLFWQGSITHQPDIELLRTPMEGLNKRSPYIQVVMGGMEDNFKAWQEMADVFTAQGKHRYKLIKGSPVTEYYSLYADADICLVPLCNNKFNRMKSNLKVLEAAHMGLPVIASAVHPYIGLPVMMCKSSKDWIGHITRLTMFPARAEEAGAEIKEFCQEHYSFDKINAERLSIYEHAIKTA